MDEIGPPGYYGLGTLEEEVDPKVNMKALLRGNLKLYKCHVFPRSQFGGLTVTDLLV